MTDTVCRGRGKGYCPLQQKSIGTAGTAGYLRPFPHRGGTSQLDHENDVARQYRGLIAAHGPVHVLVVDFGGYPIEDVFVVDMSIEQWKSTCDINMTSPFLMVRRI